MSPSVAFLHNVQSRQLGQDNLQQTAPLQVFKTDAGMRSHDDFIEFHFYALPTDYLDAVCHLGKCLECFFLYLKIQLGGKADAAHHAQWIVRERDFGIERSGDDTVLQVGNAVEGIHQFSEAVAVQTDSHCIDGKVTTVLVILQRPVFHDGFARVVLIAFLTCSHELNLLAIIDFHLCRSEVLENREVGFPAQFLLQFLGHTDTATHHHNVDIVGGAFQKDIAHIAAHHITLHTEAVGHSTDLMEYLLV